MEDDLDITSAETSENTNESRLMELEENTTSVSLDKTSIPSDKTAEDLAAIFDVPVKVSAVLGRTQIEISELLKIGVGSVIELDRKVGEAIDVYVNNRLIARGEVVLVDDKLGVTMTEIIKTETN